MKQQIISDINKFKEEDIYSAMLYALYKLSNNKTYSTLSELIYILDKDNFLNLCSVLGGCTITIPTIEQLSNLTRSLLVYQYITVENKTFREACSLAGVTKEDKEVIKIYKMIVEILKNGAF